MIDRIEVIEKSKGYQTIIQKLNYYFSDTYEIRGILCTEDSNSFDFSFIVDLPNLKGIEVGIGGSGKPQMYRIGGNGCIFIFIPISKGSSYLLSKQEGESLDRILNDESIKWGASVDFPDEIKNYFELFINYYNKNYYF